MSTPLVSVIIPTFNREGLLRRAVDSVLAQTFADWECIIVDDRSTDGTAKLLSELRTRDERIVTHVMERNSGNTITRSHACSLARGEYLAILDDDDWWEPAKLQMQIAAMQAAPNAAWSYHAAQLVSPAGKGDVELVRHGDDFLQRLAQYNWLRHSSMIFRRSAFEAVGGYDRRLRLASDWDLILRLTLRYGADTIVTLPDLLVNYWQHPGGISTNGALRTRTERRLVRRMLFREGLLWKKPGLALRMLDRQIDRDMHCAMSEGRFLFAFMAASASALARPFRLWRWQRAATFGTSVITRQRPAHRAEEYAPLAPDLVRTSPAQDAPPAMTISPAASRGVADALVDATFGSNGMSSAMLRARECDGPAIANNDRPASPSRAEQREYA